MRAVRDALYNAGCWEVARLGWEETYGIVVEVTEVATSPTVAVPVETMAEVVNGKGD
jgi:hypothetical protein